MPLGMPVLAIDERTALQHGVLTDDYIMAAALYYDQLLTAPAAVDTSDSESGNADATDSDSDSDASDAAARRRADLHDAACEPLVAAALAAELVKLRVDGIKVHVHGRALASLARCARLRVVLPLPVTRQHLLLDLVAHAGRTVHAGGEGDVVPVPGIDSGVPVAVETVDDRGPPRHNRAAQRFRVLLDNLRGARGERVC